MRSVRILSAVVACASMFFSTNVAYADENNPDIAPEFMYPTDEDTSTEEASAPYVSYRDGGNGIAYNYAVNLASSVTTNQFSQAVTAAQKNSGVVLSQYPQLKSFTVQAAKAGYAAALAKSLTASKIPFHSIGYTRNHSVSDEEIVVSGAKKGQYVTNKSVMGFSGVVTTGKDMKVTGADEARKVNVSLEKVTVGVMDSGVDGLHHALKGKVDYSTSANCLVNGISRALREGRNDVYGHGTHVAGTIAADAQQGELLVKGVAPNARLADIRVLNSENIAYSEHLVCGYVWAAEHNIDILNLSLGGFEYVRDRNLAASAEIERRAVYYAASKDVLLVAAAGNSGIDLDNLTRMSYWDRGRGAYTCDVDISQATYAPAQIHPNIVVVSAIESQQSPGASYKPYRRSVWSVNTTSGCQYAPVSASNYGAKTIDVTAPGTHVFSTLSPALGFGFDSGAASGTSMATPHVSGVAALLKGIHPDYSAVQIRSLLLKQAGARYGDLVKPADGKEYRGSGLVNALAAVTKDQPKPTITQIEYSADGGKTWARLGSAPVWGAIKIRVTAQGPVTALDINVPSVSSAKATGDGSFSSSVSATVDMNVTASSPEIFTLNIKAFGRNNDSRADDDISTKVTFKKRVLVTSMRVTGASTVDEGASTVLKAVVSPSAATNKTVAWSSSNTTIATVNSEGVVTGKKPGSVTITAKAKDGSGKSASMKITVKKLPETVTMYRLYNKSTGEHFYTSNMTEKNTLVSQYGWTYEGVAWLAPKKSNTPVYRLYHPVFGDHHYTSDPNEKKILVTKHGWKYENIGWYSDDAERVPVYRQYNPKLRIGAHHYTVSKKEYDTNNSKHGWRGEGVAWYAVKTR